MKTKEKLLLLVPALWASLFDITITIVNQPEAYWNGDLTKGNEGNPIGSLFMANHIAGLFVISTLWIVTIGVLGYILPRQTSKIFLLFCVIAHSFGASTWLTRYGFWYAIIFILSNSILYCVIDNLVNSRRTGEVAR